MEVHILTCMEPMPELPEMLLTMTLPLEIKHLVRLISKAYMDTLTSIPDAMSSRIPNLNACQMPISLMVWNVQGAGSQAFLAALKELIRVHKPLVIALVETHMGGEQTQFIAKQINLATLGLMLEDLHGASRFTREQN
ncbi:Uroporphyrinogen decarboxylase [Bienertia sinuspersici]